jgi:RNAse (barnase) inhibitor barstar
MKRCILDGDALTDVVDIYRQLGATFDAPEHFGNNPDALWDLLTEYAGEHVQVTWRNSARSRTRFGADFEATAAVLRKGAAEGLLVLRLE